MGKIQHISSPTKEENIARFRKEEDHFVQMFTEMPMEDRKNYYQVLKPHYQNLVKHLVPLETTSTGKF